MSAATGPRSTTRAERRRGAQLALVGLLLGIAAAGWLITGDRMAGMDAGPGTDLGSLGFYVGAWVVMMAAMMFPSAAPTVLAYAWVHDRRRDAGRGGTERGATAVFAAGYLLAWTVFGLVAYGLLELIGSLDVGVLSWDRAGRYVAGAAIATAAIYQLTPVKDVCLARCRGPLAFVVARFRDGYGGALRMGAEHGGWCVGCCWALMAVLFAVGAMSVGWMAFVAALIAVEKLVPSPAMASRGIALVLAVLACGVAFAPQRVPGLTLPDAGPSHERMTTGRP